MESSLSLLSGDSASVGGCDSNEGGDDDDDYGSVTYLNGYPLLQPTVRIVQPVTY